VAFHRCPRRLPAHDSPQVWKHVWTERKSCKSPCFRGGKCRSGRIEASVRRCYARPPRNLLRGASEGWRTIPSRPPSACGTMSPAGSVRHSTRRPTQPGSATWRQVSSPRGLPALRGVSGACHCSTSRNTGRTW